PAQNIPQLEVGEVSSVAFSRNGEVFAAGGGESRPRLWNARTFKELAPLAELYKYVACLALSPDGKWLVTGGEDKIGEGRYAVRLWSVGLKEPVRELTFDQSINSIAFAPDGKKIAAGFYDGAVREWDDTLTRELFLARAVENESKGKNGALSVAFSP